MSTSVTISSYVSDQAWNVIGVIWIVAEEAAVSLKEWVFSYMIFYFDSNLLRAFWIVDVKYFKSSLISTFRSETFKQIHILNEKMLQILVFDCIQ